MSTIDREKWMESSHFPHRPWFCRVWIVQEVALAYSALVGIGKYWIPWATCVLAVDGITFHHADSFLSQSWENPNFGLLSIRLVAAIKAGLNAPSSNNELLHTLDFVRSFKSTEAKDKYFALRAI